MLKSRTLGATHVAHRSHLGAVALAVGLGLVLALVGSCSPTSTGNDGGEGGGAGGAGGGNADGGVVNPSDLSCLKMIPLRLWTTNPSAVALLYRIETCKGETVRLAPVAPQTVGDLYTLTENASPLSSEAVPSVSLSAGQRVYVSLLLDFSSSTQPVKTQLLESARLFSETLVNESPKAYVTLRIFDGRAAAHTVLLPTRDLSEVRRILGELATATTGSPILGPAPDTGSTNLYGAFDRGVADLQAWQDLVMTRNGGGVVTSGYTVVFTDGADTSNSSTQALAKQRVSDARQATGANSSLPNVQSYAVALQGTDYTAAARASLADIVGEPRYLLEGSIAELSTKFTELAQTIARQSEATHLLTYCSAARAGQRAVILAVQSEVGGATADSTAIQFGFSADGFAGGCIDFFRTVCDGKDCGGFNCGACDDATETCTTATGLCGNDCLDKNLCSGESSTNTLGYVQTCSFGTSVTKCGAQCINTSADPSNCGACGVRCNTTAGQACVAGACGCTNGGAVCGGQCQTSAFFANNNAHCGACNNACTGGATCQGTACSCPGGGVFCAGACRDASWFADNLQHCGACNTACGTGGVCAAGVCSCPGVDGFVCNGACVDRSSSTAHCGACNNACTGTGQACVTGACACPGVDGFVCNGACVDRASSTAHCGACNNACSATGQSCSAGACRCAGASDVACAGVCRPPTYFESNNAHCGACNNACAVGATCANNACSCPAGVDPFVCNGTCVERDSDRNNCGACGVACGAVCGAGACTSVAEVSAGMLQTCARLSDGSVYCSGTGTSGQLGNGVTATQLRPGPVELSPGVKLVGVAQIVAHNTSTCARLTNGEVWCWGLAALVGNGATVNQFRPVRVETAPGVALQGVASVEISTSHACARLSVGEVYCWGAGTYGMLGNGATTAQTRAVRVETAAGIALTGVASLEMGVTSTCARLSSGEVRCWGRGNAGQLGNGSLVDQSRPVVVEVGPGVALAGVAEVTLRSESACGRLVSGEVHCWGRGASGQMGNGTTGQQSRPVRVETSPGVALQAATHISSGPDHVCARLMGGEVYCWGLGTSGQLGDGSLSTQLRPVRVELSAGVPLQGTSALWPANPASNGTLSCAQMATGELFCWGGQYAGGGLTTYRARPERVEVAAGVPLSGVGAFSMGAAHVCARTATGRSWCWGQNGGRLGDGSTTTRPRPVEAAWP